MNSQIYAFNTAIQHALNYYKKQFLHMTKEQLFRFSKIFFFNREMATYSSNKNCRSKSHPSTVGNSMENET